MNEKSGIEFIVQSHDGYCYRFSSKHTTKSGATRRFNNILKDQKNWKAGNVNMPYRIIKQETQILIENIPSKEWFRN